MSEHRPFVCTCPRLDPSRKSVAGPHHDGACARWEAPKRSETEQIAAEVASFPRAFASELLERIGALGGDRGRKVAREVDESLSGWWGSIDRTTILSRNGDAPPAREASEPKRESSRDEDKEKPKGDARTTVPR